jgi:ATP-dependent Clp protease ATP-binding subunit ClpB
MFTPLSREDVKDIVKIQFNRIVKRMGNQDLKIEISDEAVNWLTTVGYDPQYGARPVNRLLQKYVLNELSKKILAGEVSINKTIQIIMEEDELRFRDKQ